jgi:hypothetical protein
LSNASRSSISYTFLRLPRNHVTDAAFRLLRPLGFNACTSKIMGATTLSITTFSITTFSIRLSIKIRNLDTQHNCNQCFCQVLLCLVSSILSVAICWVSLWMSFCWNARRQIMTLVKQAKLILLYGLSTEPDLSVSSLEGFFSKSEVKIKQNLKKEKFLKMLWIGGETLFNKNLISNLW